MLKKSLLILSCGFILKSVFAEEVKIGVQVPISGKFASEGRGIDNAVRLLVEQENSKGGINGNKFSVVTCDDEGSTQKAVICAKKLINDGVKVVIGSYTSTATEASQALYAKASIIHTSDATSATIMKNHYPNYFRCSFNDNVEGEFTANYFINVKHYKRIAILSDYSAFSVGLADSVIKNLQKLNGNIIYQGKLTTGNQDFKAILTDIKSKNPDVIYYSGYFTEGSLLRLQQTELGISADFVGGNSNDNPEFIKIAGKAAIGSYLLGLPLPEQLSNNIAKQFTVDYQNKYKISIPSIWTLTNLDGLLVTLTAMKQTKSTDTKELSKYIHGNIKNQPSYTGTISIGGDGERQGSLYQVSKINQDMQYSVVFK